MKAFAKSFLIGNFGTKGNHLTGKHLQVQKFLLFEYPINYNRLENPY